MSFILFTYGAIFASFITLCAYRIPNQISILNPRSSCDHCQTSLRHWQLIPIIGFIIQRGKCYDCRQPINIQSTILEIITGLIAINAPYQNLIHLIEFIIFYSALLFITATDLNFQYFYSLTLLGLIPGIDLFHSYYDWNLSLLILLILTLTILLTLAHLTHGLGFGDIELIIIFEILVGVYATLQLILIASIVAIFYLMINHQRKKIAFVPFLSLGFICINFYM